MGLEHDDLHEGERTLARGGSLAGRNPAEHKTPVGVEFSSVQVVRRERVGARVRPLVGVSCETLRIKSGPSSVAVGIVRPRVPVRTIRFLLSACSFSCSPHVPTRSNSDRGRTPRHSRCDGHTVAGRAARGC